MVSPFTLSPVEKGIMRCRHSGSFTPEDIRSLADFLYNYHGKLLIDLSGTSADECVRHIKEFRPMMPTAAIFGAKFDPAILHIPDSYYVKEVRYFETEGEALAWLREK